MGKGWGSIVVGSRAWAGALPGRRRRIAAVSATALVLALVAAAPGAGASASSGSSGTASAAGDPTYTPPRIVPASPAPIVAVAVTPDSAGAWEAASNGDVYAYGDAPADGSMAGHALTAPVVGMAATHTGNGYWLVASDGGIFSFGSAEFHGSMGGHHLNKPIVAMASDPATGGYWMVASDGGIFSFGAPFYGSTGAMHLNSPIVGMAATPTDKGYWLVASDGGVFSFGAATFHGSMGGHPLAAPVVAMATDPATGGYWEIASDGTIYAFAAPSYGSPGASPYRVTSMTAEDAGSGYLWCDAAGICGSASASDAVTGHAYLPPQNPPANVPMNPTYQYPQAAGTPGACWGVSGSSDVPEFTRAACVAEEMAATNYARSLEGLTAMELPSDYAALTTEEQVFVLTDLERVSRGEQPVLGLSARLDQDAQAGAQDNADPSFSVLSTLPTYDGAGSNWGASRSALDVNYYWMYLDGWNGAQTYNSDCTSAGAPGCWGHRDNILVPSGAMVMGAGYAPDNWNGYGSYAEILVTLRSAAGAPPMYYTWADAVAAGADP